MALTETARGTGGNTTGATSIAIVPASTVVVGSCAVLFLAHDNSGTSGADPYSAISDNTAGGLNAWTSRQAVLSDPGAANAGVAGRIFTCAVVTQITTGNTITVNFGAFSVPAKAWALREFTGSDGAPYFRQAGPAGGNIPADLFNPQLTINANLNDRSALMAGFFIEGNAAPTSSDTDTNQGTWGALWGVGQGSAATGIEVRAQTKIMTAWATTQTFNHVYAAGRDKVGGWVEIAEAGRDAPRSKRDYPQILPH